MATATGTTRLRLFNKSVQLAGQGYRDIVGVVQTAGVGDDDDGGFHVGCDLDAAAVQIVDQVVVRRIQNRVAGVNSGVALVQTGDGIRHVRRDLVAGEGGGHHVGGEAGRCAVADEVVIQIAVGGLTEITAVDLLLHVGSAADRHQHHKAERQQCQQQTGQPA